jgi:hypothetical protein
VFATEAIPEGAVLFSVPKALCVGVGCGDPEVDDQSPLVSSLLSLRSDPLWADRLAPLFAEAEGGSSCAFCWDPADLPLLAGTELEAVVAAKLARVKEEAERLGVEVGLYTQLCGVAISHQNPWWDR